jgi:hypothetical protein
LSAHAHTCWPSRKPVGSRSWLRAAFSNEKTDEAAAGLRLAWALELVVDENLDEPLELGWPKADAVIRALPEVEAHA